MQGLEKILEEIGELRGQAGSECTSEDHYIKKAWEHCLDRVVGIIRKHMNDGWIPVEDGLPEVCRKIEEDSECPEYNVTIPGAEKATTLKYSPADETWFDDLGYVYPVIAWQPLPEIYHPERSDNHDTRRSD